MSGIEANDSSRSGRYKKGRRKNSSTHIDMTPMVDLAFLLLTFFVLTSVFIRPNAIPLGMPVDGKPKNVRNILTLLIDKSDSIHYYYGSLDSLSSAPFKVTDYGKRGIRQVLIDHNRKTFTDIQDIERKISADPSLSIEEKRELFKSKSNSLMGNDSALTVLIKTCDNAKYFRVIDMLDETSIAGIDKKAIVNISDMEKELLLKQKLSEKKEH